MIFTLGLSYALIPDLIFNAAIKKEVWQKFKFDEIVLGREDLVLALTLQNENLKIDYTPDAQVEHLHEERWTQIKNRFFR